MAKRFEKKIIIVLVTLFLIVLAIDARPLKSKRLQKLTLSLKRKINFPIDLDKLRFEKAIEVMELFSKRGISLVDARKRNPFLDKVINILDERNKNDSTITGKMFDFLLITCKSYLPIYEECAMYLSPTIIWTRPVSF